MAINRFSALSDGDFRARAAYVDNSAVARADSARKPDFAFFFAVDNFDRQGRSFFNFADELRTVFRASHGFRSKREYSLRIVFFNFREQFFYSFNRPFDGNGRQLFFLVEFFSEACCYKPLKICFFLRTDERADGVGPDVENGENSVFISRCRHFCKYIPSALPALRSSIF